jgi:hypothetical protein
MDANGIVRTAEATIANSAVFRTSGGSGPALWDIAWSITNEGTGDFTRFIAMAGAPPHFVRDGLTPGETEFENATVSGPVTVAQWNGQWGNTLTASGGAVYFFAAATIPEPGTMTLFGLALLILSSGVHRRRSGAGGSYPCAFASVTQS